MHMHDEVSGEAHRIHGGMWHAEEHTEEHTTQQEHMKMGKQKRYMRHR